MMSCPWDAFQKNAENKRNWGAVARDAHQSMSWTEIAVLG